MKRDLAEFVQLTRVRLAAGDGYDEILALLRERGVGKGETRFVLADASDLSVHEAAVLIHQSPVWADRREIDEAAEDWFVRSLYLIGLAGEAEVGTRDSSYGEIVDLQRQARPHLDAAAALFPDDVLAGYQESVADNRLGEAFGHLVAAGRRHGMAADGWRELVRVSEILCLGEWLGPDEPKADDLAFMHAAYDLRGRVI